MDNWKEELKRVDVDVEGAIARFCNKEERYIKYLKLFHEDNSYDKLKEALKENNCLEAFESCHSLKGVVGNLGFRTIFPNIYDACEILRTGTTEGVQPLVDDIEDNYNEIINIIEKCLI